MTVIPRETSVIHTTIQIIKPRVRKLEMPTAAFLQVVQGSSITSDAWPISILITVPQKFSYGVKNFTTTIRAMGISVRAYSDNGYGTRPVLVTLVLTDTRFKTSKPGVNGASTTSNTTAAIAPSTTSRNRANSEDINAWATPSPRPPKP